ncbi:MAG TPA: hypothetical protein VNL70_04100 [Tepidisphaeraceae bacterium]|jgi:hypothetical protein|nr:hypothetical protein [Tepidisphaeraceae bacterium]
MRPRPGQFVVRLLSLATLATVALLPPTQATDARTANDDSAAAASLQREVKLRKLHLVRPDLIPYPILFEVYC